MAEQPEKPKSWRITLQETIQEENGEGSASRLTMILGMLTLCVGLIALIAAAVILAQDHDSLITTLVLAISGGGATSYSMKQIFGKAIKPGTPDPPKEP
jgi:uncharacterized membrane-anchored protein